MFSIYPIENIWPGKNFPERKLGAGECKKNIKIFRSILKSPVRESDTVFRLPLSQGYQK